MSLTDLLMRLWLSKVTRVITWTRDRNGNLTTRRYCACAAIDDLHNVIAFVAVPKSSKHVNVSVINATIGSTQPTVIARSIGRKHALIRLQNDRSVYVGVDSTDATRLSCLATMNVHLVAMRCDSKILIICETCDNRRERQR